MTLTAMLRRCDLAGIKVTWTKEPRGWTCLGSRRKALVRSYAATGTEALHRVLEGMGLA